MLPSHYAKTAALLIAAVAVAVAVATLPFAVATLPAVVLLWPLYHACWVHLGLNVWCLLVLVWRMHCDVAMIFAALVIAWAFPYEVFSVPTVGLSGVCWAMIGMLSPRVRQPEVWFTYISVYLAIGFLLPGVNAWLHAWCFVWGWLLWKGR